ncbi:hypothetical protein CCAX7_28310 [Capsulimonas corticalis]|uniref:Uncharacterized protein n=1 Tax=Capsulimonas corticalis TaxID=2219043 RepID=A0A402CTC5_9BACT|nr:hypothetical protein [Capsulimonas corticalis]BDI30780.1 hypothetical protein CCAX7_28310 [Capsulimonas corticalis]
MKRHLLPALALLSIAPLAYGQTASVSETTILQNITARDAAYGIKSAQKLDELTCNFHDNAVTARGSQEAVTAFEKDLHAADVPMKQFQITLRVVRYHVDKQGKCVEKPIQTPIITTTDKTTASISTQGDDGLELVITPQSAPDNAVNLAVEVRTLGEQGEVMCSGKNTLLAPFGKTVRITGMTEAKDKLLRRAVMRGEVVTDRGEYTGYYVEATTTTPAGA